MESSQSLRTLLQKSEYLSKLDLKDTYLCVPLSQDDGRRVRFRWELTLYQFLCLCFVLALAPCFHKTLKNPNGPFKKDRDTHGNLFGRHVDYWQNKGRHFSSAKYDHSFSAVPGNCYKSEKVSNDTGPGKKFLGMIVNSKEVTISLPQKKLQSTNICVRICIRIQ